MFYRARNSLPLKGTESFHAQPEFEILKFNHKLPRSTGDEDRRSSEHKFSHSTMVSLLPERLINNLVRENSPPHRSAIL